MLDLFYLMLVATILGFLTVFQVRANASGFQLRGWTAFVVLFTCTCRKLEFGTQQPGWP